jgi:hypothetical protein
MGMETVGREAALERGAGAGSVKERGRASRAQFENGRSAAWQRGKKRGRGGGGLAAGVPRSAGRRRGAWPRPAGGAPTVSRPAVTRTRTVARWRRHGRAPVAVRAGRREWRPGARGPA